MKLIKTMTFEELSEHMSGKTARELMTELSMTYNEFCDFLTEHGFPTPGNCVDCGDQ